MKKIILYIFSFITICFIVPAIFTKRHAINTSNENVSSNNEQSEIINDNKEEDSNKSNNEHKNYVYKKYGNIKLLHTKTGEIEDVQMDDYLYHVVSAEMPVNFELQALEAQAIVARTYTVFKILNKKHENADICDDSNCCQAWVSKEERLARWDESERESNWKKITDAVNNTSGKIITYNNQPINAFFHANSGGATEIPVNVWGGNEYPYLQSIQTSGEEGYSQYLSELIISKEDLLSKIKESYSDISIDFGNSEDLKIIEYTETGRVKTVKFGNHNLSGVETRKILGLKSTNFEIHLEGDKIKFVVKGYGHGVGMSQTGADALAKQGKSAEEIIKHFYAGVEISNI